MPINPSAIVDGSGTSSKSKLSSQVLPPTTGRNILTEIPYTSIYAVPVGAVITPVSKKIQVPLVGRLPGLLIEAGGVLESIRFESMAGPMPAPLVPKKETWMKAEPVVLALVIRSEERRVGKECRSRW